MSFGVLSSTFQPSGSMWRSLLLVAATTLLGTLCEAGLLISRCPEGQYYSSDDRSCQPCGMCPKNQIVRIPCAQHSDTVCGPFFEFYKFHQASPRPTLDKNSDLHQLEQEEEDEGNERKSEDTDLGRPVPPPLDSSLPDSAYAGQPRRNHPSRGNPRGEDADFEDGEALLPGETPRAEGRDGPPYPGRRHDSSQHQQQPPSVQAPLGEEEGQWKVLALALIVVLCVVCIFLIVFIFVVCYLRAGHPECRAKNAALLAGTATGFHTGSERSRPPVIPYYYVQLPVRAAQAQSTTFGPGERSTAAVTTSSEQLQEGTEDSEADGRSGHMHTAASSEYVYFKSPQNGNLGAEDV